jgi:hypothetical protein
MTQRKASCVWSSIGVVVSQADDNYLWNVSVIVIVRPFQLLPQFLLPSFADLKHRDRVFSACLTPSPREKSGGSGQLGARNRQINILHIE